MTFDLSDPTFHDEDKAREHIEASRWPDGVNCQHCGSFNVMRMAGKTQAGYFLCRDCQGKFTCRTEMPRPSRSAGQNPPVTSSHPSNASAAAHSTHTQNVHRNFGIGTLAAIYHEVPPTPSSSR